jgi:hypothetical protein
MNPTPTRKVTVGAFAASCSILVTWLIRVYTFLDPPPEVTAAVATIVYFVTGLFVPENTPEEKST